MLLLHNSQEETFGSHASLNCERHLASATAARRMVAPAAAAHVSQLPLANSPHHPSAGRRQRGCQPLIVGHLHEEAAAAHQSAKQWQQCASGSSVDVVSVRSSSSSKGCGGAGCPCCFHCCLPDAAAAASEQTTEHQHRKGQKELLLASQRNDCDASAVFKDANLTSSQQQAQHASIAPPVGVLYPQSGAACICIGVPCSFATTPGSRCCGWPAIRLILVGQHEVGSRSAIAAAERYSCPRSAPHDCGPCEATYSPCRSCYVAVR